MIEDGQERSAQTSKSRRDQAFPPLPRHYTFISGTTTKKMQSNLPPPQFLGGGGVSYKIACPAISRPIHRGQQFSTGSYPKVLSSANGRSHVCHNSKPFASTPPPTVWGGVEGEYGLPAISRPIHRERYLSTGPYHNAVPRIRSSQAHQHTNNEKPNWPTAARNPSNASRTVPTIRGHTNLELDWNDFRSIVSKRGSLTLLQVHPRFGDKLLGNTLGYFSQQAS